MKKSIALVAMAFGVSSAFAQDLTSKKGEPFLPEAGDYAIAIDATPFLNYAGTFFGKTNTSGAPTWNFYTNNMTIWGKQFKDANTAYRAGIRLGFGSTKQEALVSNDATTTDANDKVSDTWKSGGSNIGLTVGLEKRRGKTRLQGVYGAEFGFSLSTSKQTYSYGNAYTTTNTAPTSNNFNGNAGGGSRTTTNKNGATIGLGIRAFVGAEYFIAPKISIGGEFGWGLALTTTGQGTKTTESWDAVNNTVKSVDTKTGKSSSFSLDTQGNQTVFGANPAAALKLTLHF